MPDSVQGLLMADTTCECGHDMADHLSILYSTGDLPCALCPCTRYSKPRPPRPVPPHTPGGIRVALPPAGDEPYETHYTPSPPSGGDAAPEASWARQLHDGQIDSGLTPSAPTVRCPANRHDVAATRTASGEWVVPGDCPACVHDSRTVKPSAPPAALPPAGQLPISGAEIKESPAALPPIPDGHPHAEALRTLARAHETDRWLAACTPQTAAHDIARAEQVRASYAALLASPSVVADAGAGTLTIRGEQYERDADGLWWYTRERLPYSTGARWGDVLDEVARLTSALDAATRRAEAAEADAARLDWVEDNALLIRPILSQDPEAGKWAVSFENVDREVVRDTIRDALDALGALDAYEIANQESR